MFSYTMNVQVHEASNHGPRCVQVQTKASNHRSRYSMIIKKMLQNNNIVVIIFSFFQCVGLTRHEAKTEGEPYVEHDEEADESANRDPVPVLVWILSAGHQCGHSHCGGRVCRIWLHSQTNKFSHHICQMHQHVVLELMPVSVLVFLSPCGDLNSGAPVAVYT